MSDYVNLDTIHIPNDGSLVPAAWGHGIRQDFDYFYRPHHFVGKRTSDAVGNLASGSVVEIGWNFIIRHSGEFLDPSEPSASTFTAPVDGFYMVHCALDFLGTVPTLPSPTSQIYVALMVIDDSSTNNFLLRSSTHLETVGVSMGGATYLSAGTNFAFVAYQDTGTEAQTIGDCSITYLGGVL